MQIGEKSRGGVKGAIPGVILGSGEDGQVKVETSHGESFWAGGEGVEAGGEFVEEGGVLEAECVGGVDEVVCLVIDLSTRAEETDREMHATLSKRSMGIASNTTGRTMPSCRLHRPQRRV